MLENINEISNQIVLVAGVCFVALYVYMLIKAFHNFYNKK
jgi:hypothetical protein